MSRALCCVSPRKRMEPLPGFEPRSVVYETTALPIELQGPGDPGRTRTHSERFVVSRVSSYTTGSSVSVCPPRRVRRRVSVRVMVFWSKEMVGPVGFEPTPYSISGCRLCQLGYGPLGGGGGIRTHTVLILSQVPLPDWGTPPVVRCPWRDSNPHPFDLESNRSSVGVHGLSYE